MKKKKKYDIVKILIWYSLELTKYLRKPPPPTPLYYYKMHTPIKRFSFNIILYSYNRRNDLLKKKKKIGPSQIVQFILISNTSIAYCYFIKQIYLEFNRLPRLMFYISLEK